jgi:hypothetical protein
MTDTCKTCRWFHKGGRDGVCRNPVHATVRYVGGGGEYSSSERCLVPPTVWETQWCALHSTEAVPPIRPVTVEEQQARWEEDRRTYFGRVTETVSPMGSRLSDFSALLSGKPQT